MNRALMHWTFPDTPFSKRDDFNAQRLAVATKADQCIKWLMTQGFEIAQVKYGPRNPRIYIKTSPLCKELDGAVWMYERSANGERRYWVAIRFECEVRWVDACPEQGRRGGV